VSKPLAVPRCARGSREVFSGPGSRSGTGDPGVRRDDGWGYSRNFAVDNSHRGLVVELNVCHDVRTRLAGGMMRRLWYAVVPVVVLAGVLAGCTRVPPVDPGPSTTTPVVVSVTPSTTTPTPVTPTPTWDANQQGAIDAVQEYLAVWADIGQHLPDAAVERITALAGEGMTDDDLATWTMWTEKGWHLVGAPNLEVWSAVPSMVDSKGTRYYVNGCYSIEGSYIVDSSNTPIPANNRVERAPAMYTVLHAKTGEFTVLDNVRKDGTC